MFNKYTGFTNKYYLGWSKNTIIETQTFGKERGNTKRKVSKITIITRLELSE